MVDSLQTRLTALRALAVLLSAPVIFYTIRIIFWAMVIWYKTGWDSRPLYSMLLADVFVYLVYVCGVVVGLGYFAQLTKDRLIRFCTLAVALMLGIYWVGLLTGSLGTIIPERKRVSPHY